eukprot:6192959-Pleurochrysis_carterae.AAC.1
MAFVVAVSLLLQCAPLLAISVPTTHAATNTFTAIAIVEHATLAPRSRATSTRPGRGSGCAWVCQCRAARRPAPRHASALGAVPAAGPGGEDAILYGFRANADGICFAMIYVMHSKMCDTSFLR